MIWLKEWEMFRQLKAKIKKSKNAKKIEADKQSANPKHYPLQLSQNEIEYVRNALSSVEETY